MILYDLEPSRTNQIASHQPEGGGGCRREADGARPVDESTGRIGVVGPSPQEGCREREILPTKVVLNVAGNDRRRGAAGGKKDMYRY